MMSLPLPPLARFAFGLLPRPKRRAIQTLLAWWGELGGRLEKALREGGPRFQEQLAIERDAIRALYAADVSPGALASLVREAEIPRATLVAALDGWNLLLLRQRPRDECQLDTMVRQLAARPAGALAAILAEGRSDQALEAAGKWAMGTGLIELTRRTDACLDKGLVPFPESHIERFRVDGKDFLDRRHSPQLQDLVWYQLKRAQGFLGEAVLLADAFPADGSRAFVRTMIAWPCEIASRIEKAEFRVFDVNVELNRVEALRLVWKERGREKT